MVSSEINHVYKLGSKTTTNPSCISHTLKQIKETKGYIDMFVYAQTMWEDTQKNGRILPLGRLGVGKGKVKLLSNKYPS